MSLIPSFPLVLFLFVTLTFPPKKFPVSHPFPFFFLFKVVAVTEVVAAATAVVVAVAVTIWVAAAVATKPTHFPPNIGSYFSDKNQSTN